ncbi:acylpyruvase FAHD1, mitochondrial isoform X2 [Cimex lectularius]|uniref:oxaloacetate tautomerase n=1 Tax=Cimex lectularius TaxID=79782 RepID=A0A8I6SUP3_CIMLE|nr:acylpyruvase FAHD1, mitochondrial isoform X2 [Cimex lectularius]
MKVNVCNFIAQSKKIIGAGLNFKSVAKEKGIPLPTEPVLFLKPTSSFIQEDKDIEIPPNYEVNHEVELGVIIGKKGKNIPRDEVPNYIGGYCLALDLTAMNKLQEAWKQALPWTMSKSFDTACPVSKAISRECLPCPDKVTLWLKVNGTMKQEGNTSDMVFPISDLVSYISKTITLEPYDVILTGTPAGVGPIKSGDTVCAGLNNLISMKFLVK